LLTASDAKRQRLFFWRWGPTFKIVEAPAELLRPLYRRLPRSFAVQDGEVRKTYSGLPPLPRAAPKAVPAAAGGSSGAGPASPASTNGSTTGNQSERPH
jgi:hypothetical protein